MRILIATDAWTPQINGVVTTLVNTVAVLRSLGHDVHVVSPEGFRTIPMPSYPEIPLALMPGRGVARQMNEFAADVVHVATEGTIGAAARAWCLAHRVPFTTWYHTSFPEYVTARTGLPIAMTAAWMRRFHAPAHAVLVTTEPMRALLESRRFQRVVTCPLGVDLDLFTPSQERFTEYPRPVFTYVGRLAVEKDVGAFLSLDLPGTKLVVGDGPDRAKLQRRFPGAIFTGYKTGVELASHYQRSDVLVMPSRTETYGLVMLEALACGVPVAAFPVQGPLEVIRDPATGVLDADLRKAALAALALDRSAGPRQAARFPWSRSVARFLELQAPAATRRPAS